MRKYLCRSFLVGFGLLVPIAVQAQSITAFKSGERVSGMTKQCFYNGVGNEYTKTINSVELCPLSIKVEAVPKAPKPDPEPRKEATITAFKSGERTTGMTKQCFYNGLGSTYTHTVSSVGLCPLSIKVKLP